jgi:hypothetical protein
VQEFRRHQPQRSPREADAKQPQAARRLTAERNASDFRGIP